MTNETLLTPMDEHNRGLLENVHPPDHRNPEPKQRYNLVVIGAGTAGLVTAAGAVGLGARVALVERGLMGGDCLNVGCVPSKALIRSAHAAAEARAAADFGLRPLGEVEADFGAVMARVRRLRTHISPNDSVGRFTRLGVDVFLGDGRFAGPDTVEVGGATLRFRKAVICTGGRAAAPLIEGLEAAGYLTNETLFSLTEAPPRLAVIGAGPIGSEMAQAFQRLGSKVTLLQRAAQILPKEDRDAAAIVEAAMRRDGVELVLGATVERVEIAEGEKRLRVRMRNETRVVSVDEILVAAGRAPNVEGLGLDAVGVDYDPRRGVRVDDRLRTTNPRVYAAGDVCMEHKFTHAADFAARTVIANALFFGRGKLSALTIPWCTYTDPEIAHVGLSSRGANEAGVEIDTFTVEMGDVDRAVTDGEGEGFARVHVKKGSDRIVGATIVARNAGDMIGELALAMTVKVGLKRIGGVIHPYPTQAEAIRKLGDLYNRSRLTPFVKGLLQRWLDWTR